MLRLMGPVGQPVGKAQLLAVIILPLFKCISDTEKSIVRNVLL